MHGAIEMKLKYYNVNILGTNLQQLPVLYYSLSTTKHYTRHCYLMRKPTIYYMQNHIP